MSLGIHYGRRECDTKKRSAIHACITHRAACAPSFQGTLPKHLVCCLPSSAFWRTGSSPFGRTTLHTCTAERSRSTCDLASEHMLQSLQDRSGCRKPVTPVISETQQRACPGDSAPCAPICPCSARRGCAVSQMHRSIASDGRRGYGPWATGRRLRQGTLVFLRR